MAVSREDALQLFAKGGCDDGFAAVAILDDAKVLALAGAIDPNEARAVCAPQVKDQLARHQFRAYASGELDGREVRVSVVAESVFVVVVYPQDLAAVSLVAYADLHRRIESVVRPQEHDEPGMLILPSSSGGGAAGPAELPVVELGITVPRGRN